MSIILIYTSYKRVTVRRRRACQSTCQTHQWSGSV